MLSSDADVQIAVTPLIGDLASKFLPADFTAATEQALLELKWSFPVDGTKAYWVIERTKRHLYWSLLSTSADKFRYKEIYLQNRFNQYLKIVQMMDKQFTDALENDVDTFDTNKYSSLISYISTGFIYDDFGNDLTYNEWYD